MNSTCCVFYNQNFRFWLGFKKTTNRWMPPPFFPQTVLIKLEKRSFLIQIQIHLTLITFYGAPENLVAAFRTNVTGFFILNPLFGAHLAPVWNRPQNNLFADRHGKVFNMLTGKFIALMTSAVTFLACAGPYLTLSAMHKLLIR